MSREPKHAALILQKQPFIFFCTLAGYPSREKPLNCTLNGKIAARGVNGQSSFTDTAKTNYSSVRDFIFPLGISC